MIVQLFLRDRPPVRTGYGVGKGRVGGHRGFSRDAGRCGIQEFALFEALDPLEWSLPAIYRAMELARRNQERPSQ